MVLIYSTHQNTEEAVNLGHTLLKRKLAATVNIWPLQSMHMENGEVKSQLGAVLMIKTFESKIAEIEELVELNHEYAVPFVGAIEIRRFNRTFREWMGDIVK
ncbi:MAG: hypothetical protein COU10_03755 [Candidatus Harrisonbacteria bacterium CG10_big_fil_rev_8_21_14_0_10_45_28]|uniref:Divalent-cation tolerance protein CutA n=1 Tax=Candidatus Harrisonbacteria bacterium CG10_big_fil_rev_8_21_14_0_10_45_28 TaxID=1974586 RepID=A0A2H0UMJ2_9BACT|nr:MAG: hypothetical protein COU10_03755 [Candidatus Harrisonbacteria bacterium CG10_big_fil_rev_8_21_14_0_10_45_28]